MRAPGGSDRPGATRSGYWSCRRGIGGSSLSPRIAAPAQCRGGPSAAQGHHSRAASWDDARSRHAATVTTWIYVFGRRNPSQKSRKAQGEGPSDLRRRNGLPPDGVAAYRKTVPVAFLADWTAVASWASFTLSGLCSSGRRACATAFPSTSRRPHPTARNLWRRASTSQRGASAARAVVKCKWRRHAESRTRRTSRPSGS